MIDQTQVEAFCKEIESDRVERTESTTDTNKFCEAICAFANDFPNYRQPGYLLIGVRNDGSRSGLEVTDQLLQNLGGIRSDGNVLPQPALNVKKFKFTDGEVAVVEALPSDLPPVRYKGRVYIRVGSRKAIASEQEERILSERRISLARSFDARSCPGSELKDLALGQFEAYRRIAVAAETIANNHRSIEEQLASLRFYDLRQNCPTNAGILLFGKNPRYYLPGAYIQYLRLPGKTLTDKPVDQAEISGDLLGVLRELDVRINAGIITGLSEIPGTLREKAVPDYPKQAIRELIMNAVMHRNYESNTPISFYWFEDRIEIQNSGGLYGDATPQNFPSRNSYRNPVIAEAMKELGYVNRFGYGVQRAEALLIENGNPAARFEFDANTVLAVIGRRFSY